MPRKRDPYMRGVVIYPRQLANDPAISVLSLEARGAFYTLANESWDCAEPGVFPDVDELLRRKAGADLAEWERIRDPLRSVLDLSRPGFCGVPFILRARAVQERKRSVHAAAGSKGGKSSADKRKGSPATETVPEGEVEGDGETEDEEVKEAEAEQTPLSPPSGGNGMRAASPLSSSSTAKNSDKAKSKSPVLTDSEYVEVKRFFDEEFWPDYPTDAKKKAALQAMIALFRKTPRDEWRTLATAVREGLLRYLDEIAATGMERFAYACNWIDGERWNDEYSTMGPN